MKIRKQQSALCALYSAVNIFKPDASDQELQDIITNYKINVSTGLTIPQENFLIGYLTGYELQLVPNYLDTRSPIEDAFYFDQANVPDEFHFAYALLVKGDFGLLHRIWILYNNSRKITVVDTAYEETKTFNSFQELLKAYKVLGIFHLYCMKTKGQILLETEKIKHLVGQ